MFFFAKRYRVLLCTRKYDTGVLHVKNLFRFDTNLTNSTGERVNINCPKGKYFAWKTWGRGGVIVSSKLKNKMFLRLKFTEILNTTLLENGRYNRGGGELSTVLMWKQHNFPLLCMRRYFFQSVKAPNFHVSCQLLSLTVRVSCREFVNIYGARSLVPHTTVVRPYRSVRKYSPQRLVEVSTDHPYSGRRE